jgi:nucleoside-diphosphate-sugar epimerase
MKQKSLHTVLGAGALGTSLARDLVARGERVRLVNRHGSGTVPGAEIMAGDVRDAEFVRQAVAGSAVVYQCTQPRYHRWPQEFASLQSVILDAAATADARVVIADNLYSYGEPNGATISDGSVQRPTTVKGALRLAMATDALADDRIEVALARPSNYFGGGYALFDSTVVRRALGGQPMQMLGGLDEPHSFSYVPDAARAMAILGTSDKGWGRSWITPVQAAVTQRDLLARIWSEAGQTGEPRVSAMSRGAAKAIGLFVPDIRALVEMWYEFDAPFVVDSGEFERTFGVSATPLDEAVRATVESCRAA